MVLLLNVKRIFTEHACICPVAMLVKEKLNVLSLNVLFFPLAHAVLYRP